MEANKAITILEGITPAVEAVPIAGPGLVVMLGIAKQVCQAVDGARINREAYDQLAQEVARYALGVSKAIQSDTRFSPGLDHVFNQERSKLMDEVDELTAVFREILKLIDDRRKEDKKRRKKALGRLRQGIYEAWHKNDDVENVKTLTRKVEGSIKSFNIGNDIRSLEALARIEHDIKTIAAANPDLLKQELAPVLSARFDWHEIPEGCLPDTRVDLLHQIRTWVRDESPSSPHLFALTGLAGTGKTTVAQSVCIEFDRKRTTVSFFVSRSFAERRDPENIVRTIAYQLAVQHATIQSAVSSALRNGRDVLTRPLAEQVESLIMNPLRTLANSAPQVLIVIDALDECIKVGYREGGELIPLLASGIRHMSGRVKLLITSREEPKLMEMLRELGLDTQENLVRLQNIEDKLVKRDVKAYFTHHFRSISKSHGFKDLGAWPSESGLDLLVELTGKLFVFAALLVRIMSTPRINPKKRLEEILVPLSSSIYISSFQPLDELYLGVLTKAASSNEDSIGEEIRMRIRNTVGTLVLLQSPLSANALSAILKEEAFLIWGDVEHLSAVLVVPDSPHDSVTIFHPSFRDYVLTRCTDGHFRIDQADYSVFLAHCCLGVMNRGLKKDIYNIGDPSIMNEDISDLKERQDLLISRELEYACEHWMTHLSDASHLDDGIIEELNTFCHEHLLHWIEALSLLNKLSAAAAHLPAAITWCKQQIALADTHIPSLLEDVERVVEAYDIPIRAGALQIYCSALLFMPSCKLYMNMQSEAVEATLLVSERNSTWPASRRTIEGHTERVMSVAFSPDGTRIVSGSGDSTVRVWDVVSGQELARLKGHTDYVFSVSFSPNGTQIASGSMDGTVRLWDAVSGFELAQLNGHTNIVESVAFSPDGTLILSGSGDRTVRIWDAISGLELAQLNGHTDWVESVAFSPNGTQIASGSSDKTVRVWDVISCREVAQLNSHTDEVLSVVFSPSGMQVASGSKDKTVHVWNIVGDCQLALFYEHTGSVTSVAFSPNGKTIVSSSDRTIWLWDIASGSKLAQLTGHTGPVFSVAFSSEGTQVATGSWDKTVRVWDVASIYKLSQLCGHTKMVSSFAISSDRTYIASGSDDMTVLVWDVVNGCKLSQLTGHTGFVRSIAFSPNGTQLASGSRDTSVRMWDAVSGSELVQFNGHSDSVLSVAFSPDGTLIASGSGDHTVRVWDIANGYELALLDRHANIVTSVAFSPNGTQIVSGSYDKTVRVWDAVSGCELAQLNGHTNRVQSVAFFLIDPIAHSASSGSRDKTMQMWSNISTHEHDLLDDQADQIWSEAFSECSTQIVSTDIYGENRVWYKNFNSPTSNLHPHSISYTSSVVVLSDRFSYDEDSGWLKELYPNGDNTKRLCWIPPERRGLFEVFNNIVTFGSGSGIVTILSISQPA